MTETQHLPQIPPSPFHRQDSFRRLPPLSALTTSGPPPLPRSDDNYSPRTQYPPINPPHFGSRPAPLGPAPISVPPRPYGPPATTAERPTGPYSYAHVIKNEPFSPQHHGPVISPRAEIDPRAPRTLPDARYRHDEPRAHIPEPHYVSPVERSQKLPPNYPPQPPQPAPGYPMSYASASSNPTIRGSFSSHSSSAPSSAVAPPEPVQNIPRHPPQSTATRRPPQERQFDSSPYDYKLIVRQQPVAARACGFGERDRRVIDPPPIIQLQVTDKKSGAPVHDELRYGLHVLHCSLWDPEGVQEQTSLVQEQKRPTRRLMGQLVASPSVAKDEHDIEGCFFCFPDLSCRTHGQYSLRFVLMRIDPANLDVGAFYPALTEVMSNVFTVYTAKDFPGMRPSSALTRALKLQGCNIQVKKGNEKTLARKRATLSSDDDDADDIKRRRKDG